MPLCPNHHESRAADFCEVCGVEMTPVPGETPVGHTGGGTGELCPACHTEREAGGGDFCEVCGFNFKTGAGIPAPPVREPAKAEPPPEAAPVPAPTPQAPAAPAATPANLPRWELVISVAPVPHAGMPDEATPPAFAERVVALDADTLLIGRRSVRRNLAPEVSLDHDDGVSHQHARLMRKGEGGEIIGYWLLELGSSNGTTLNGAEVKPGAEMALKAGDVVEVGRWTRLTLRTNNQ